MAKSAAMRRSFLTELPKRVERVQVEAEKAITRGWKATLESLPPKPRKAVKGLVTRAEKAASDLGRRGERMLKRVERQRDELVNEFEHRAVRLVKPMAKRLDLALHSEFQQIEKRLTKLERKLAHKPRLSVVPKASA